MIKFKKIIFSLLSFLLIFERSVIFVYAQEAEVTPSPTPSEVSSPTPTSSPETNVENAAGIISDINSNSETGDNSVVFESPSPTPTASIEAIILEEAVSSSEPSPSPNPETSSSTPEPTPEGGEILTGDAASIVEVENNVNSNVVNSSVIYHTLNIYLPDEMFDIDLSLVAQNAVNKVYGQDQNMDEVASLKVLSIDNFAYVENDIVSTANTGENVVESGESGEIASGDAYSAVSVLNNVNTNIIDSSIHLVTINIFGNLEGNIILPEIVDAGGMECCGESITLTNGALVTNNVVSSAVTGNNLAIVTKEGEIETGNALSSVNIFNMVNANLTNVYFSNLYINSMGEWSGSFIGWMGEGKDSSGNIEINNSDFINGEESCPGCVGEVDAENRAIVTNNISSTAKTGGNSINSGGAKIKTGNAFSSVSLFNFINTNIIGSTGFIGIINIFGRLVGDIGGVSQFKVEEPEPVIENVSMSSSSQKQEGGKLEVSHTHNVGEYVLPGDTVTFFAKVKNPGTGRVYETKLFITLEKDGVDYGGAYFYLGDIDPLKSIKLTTGVVLSENAEPGLYTAKVYAEGVVGPDDHKITSHSESQFFIAPIYSGVNVEPFLVDEVNAEDMITPEVLGATTENKFTIEKLFGIFVSLLVVYVSGRIYQSGNLLILRRWQGNIEG